MDSIAEVKARLNIVEVLGNYLELKRAGRNFKGLCPFHAEKTPSFIVSPERQFAWCFGCQKGGDVFQMVEFLEGVEFQEALKILAEKAGVDLPANFGRGLKKEQRVRLKEIHELATDFFGRELEKNSAVQEYLRGRGLIPATWQAWQLGYAPPEADDFLKNLQERGYKAQELIQVGLASVREFGSERLVPKFFNRIIFPLTNQRGEVVAFTGRIFGEGEPKYLNSCESPIFAKGEILFGLAQEAIRAQKCALVMEGQMDVLLAHQAHFTNAVATSGTALTERHFLKLTRLTEKVVLSLDGDAAGQASTVRALALAAQADLNIKVAIWSEKFKDPAEVIQAEPKLFQKALEEALTPLDFFLTKVFAELDLTDIAQRKKVVRELLTYARSFRSALEREDFLKRLSLRLKVEYRTLLEEMALLPNLKKSKAPEVPLRQLKDEDFCLALLLHFAGWEVEKVVAAGFSLQKEENQKIWEELKKGGKPTGVQVEKLHLLALERYAEFDETKLKLELEQLLQKLRAESLRQKKRRLREEITASEAAGDLARAQALLREYAELV